MGIYVCIAISYFDMVTLSEQTFNTILHNKRKNR